MEKELKYKPTEYIANNKIVEILVRDYMVEQQFKSDLIQEVYLILLTHPQHKLQKLIESNQIKYYVARIIRNQYFSCTSNFYRKYKKSLLMKDSFEDILNKEDGDDDESFD